MFRFIAWLFLLLTPAVAIAQQSQETLIPISQLRDTSVADYFPVSSGTSAGVTWQPVSAFQGGSTMDDRFPTTGAFINYRDIIPPGNSDSKENYPPASVIDFNPETAPLVTAEFEDCSQVYNPQVIEVGDYYYMYYAGNTQKFQTNTGDVETTRKKSDFSRVDRIFLAYKHKDADIYDPWQKWEDGRTAVLDIDGLDSPGNDVGNVWLRAVYDDGTQYVMIYIGDDARNGSDHTYFPSIATSTDGISWTKQGNIVGMTGHPVVTGLFANGNHYIYTWDGANVELWRSANLSSWTLLNLNILGATYNRAYGCLLHNGTVYIGARAAATESTITLLSVPEASIETPASYTNEGTLFTGDPDYGESDNGLADSPAEVNYHSFQLIDTDQWAVFYSYYKRRMARNPFVPETGIRVQTFSNTIPIPQ